MKTKIIGIAALMFGLGAWVWTACDKIPEDEMRTNMELPEWQGKTVVLEDFTGVGCVNCPNAAEIAHGLQTLMGDKLILVELHPATTDLNSLTAPIGEGDVDLRNASATAYAEYWNVQGLPSGLINRKQASGETLSRARWRGQAISVYGEVPVATIEGSATLAGGSIAVSASGSFSQAYNTEEGDLHVLAMVLEDGFSVTQRMPGGDQPGYAHNHVLRATADNAWGTKVLDAGNIASGTTFTYSGTVSVEAGWKQADLSVALLLCNAKTKEILNAAKVRLN